MTAEIGIMNKSCVALAADSAVTINSQNNNKIYNSANKLFSLSKYHPVGIMIYGNASIMGVPWETIIKMYKKELGQQQFDTIKLYTEDFLRFLKDKNNNFFEFNKIKEYLYQIIANCYFDIFNLIDKDIEELSLVSELDINKIINDKIKFAYKTVDKNKDIKTGTICRKTKTAIKKLAQELINDIFEKLPIIKKDMDKLITIAVLIFEKEVYMFSSHSGIVFSGFGEKEIYPVTIAYEIYTVVDSCIKLQMTEENRISSVNSAVIMPFAQKEMVSTFIEGIDPQIKNVIYDISNDLFQRMPNFISSTLGLNINNDKLSNEVSNEIAKNITDEFIQKLEHYTQEHHISPIVNNVAVLPKEELAAMAEALVNLTSFKRKISLQSAETVGGPIDVAVISKGDGFIWIKRKHYFKPELNHHFFSNYFNKDNN